MSAGSSPTTARRPAAAETPLGVHHFAHLRAVAQGVSVLDAARRYLAIDHGAEAATAHRLVVDRVAAIARRRGDSRWRLIGIEIRDAGGAEAAPPPLYEWAESEGLGDWSQSELQELYAERFGEGDVGQRRRSARNARLRERRLELLRELEATAAKPAQPSDLVEGWLPVPVAEQLRQVGVLTLADLQRRVERGGRWWVPLKGFGPIKAERLARHLQLLLPPATPSTSWSVAIVGERLARFSGARGLNRVQGSFAGTDAGDDREAVQAWITARAKSDATKKQYAREAERFILWCVLERGKAMADATAEDCAAYMGFLTDVPDGWISRNNVARLTPGWAPFKGSLTIASQGMALAALHSLFAWLVQARYLASNPWVLVNRKLGDDPRDTVDDTGSRAFTPAAWTAMNAYLAKVPPSPSADRLRWICTFVEATGLRAAELLAARVENLKHTPGGWVIRVHGKGRRNRTVPIPTRALKATRSYLKGRGLELEVAAPETPLLGSLASSAASGGKGAAISYNALHETFTRFVARAFKTLPAAERRRAEEASAHWLRHTHATRAAERGVPADVLQENLGQSDPRTTARYYRAQLERRQAAMERAFS